jgi:hypothetical protein
VVTLDGEVVKETVTEDEFSFRRKYHHCLAAPAKVPQRIAQCALNGKRGSNPTLRT